MNSPSRSAALAGLVACWLSLSNTAPGANSAEKWDAAFGQLRPVNGDQWQSDQPVDCAATPKQFEQVVKNILGDPDVKIATINEPEFNNKDTPRVIVGIRCAPVHYLMKFEGGYFGVGGQQIIEITQFYIQLFEPESGRHQIRVLRRSAQHFPRNLKLQLLQQSPYGLRMAQVIKEKLIAALK